MKWTDWWVWMVVGMVLLSGIEEFTKSPAERCASSCHGKLREWRGVSATGPEVCVCLP